MTFLHLSLLAGIAMIAVPIVLHLVMRRKPTLVEFPALRFIQKRADANRRRLQLRHLLLLLLRAGIVALLALALARPSVKLSGAIGSQEAPVAAALVFDAAPHMEYRHENRTRLEAARELAQWLVAQLPEHSEIAVLDTRLGSPAAFAPDRGAAKERIARLESTSNSQSLPAAIDEAVKLLQPSKLERKEIYVFSDLSRGGWPEEQSPRLRRQLAEIGGLGVYVIDMGIDNPTDYGLSEARLSGDVLSSLGTLKIDADLSCLGAAAGRVVELHMQDASGKPQKRGQRSCAAKPGESCHVTFSVSGLTPGVHQGFLRIVGQDGLAADDTRYFTVLVKPAWRVLLAAPKPAERYARFFSEAISPESYRQSGQARFECDVCELTGLAKRQLADYAAVCLLDPTPLPEAVWKKLADYAAEGRGVAIFLGRNAVPVDSFNQPQAQELLPGELLRQAIAADDVCLAPRDFEHPILSASRAYAGSIPWDAFPVLRYWEFKSLAKGASVVLPYSDGRPAVLERPVGRGRALVMTTPVSDRPSENPWNFLPAGDAWPFVMLADQMTAYLAGSNDQQLNYLAGQTAVLQLDAAAWRRGFMLVAPDGTSSSIAPDLGRRELAVSSTDLVGNYRLQAGGADGATLGFSVNYAAGQTRLDRMTEGELAGVFGPVKYQLARTRRQIDRDVHVGRIGRELYPPLILIVALLLGLEMLLANRFYKE